VHQLEIKVLNIIDIIDARCNHDIIDARCNHEVSHRMLQDTLCQKGQSLTRTISLDTDFSVTPTTVLYRDSMTANITLTIRLRISSRRMVKEYTLRNILPPPLVVELTLFLKQAKLAVRIWHRHLEGKHTFILNN